MLQFESWKKILVLLVTVLGIVYAAPNAMPGDGSESGNFLPGQKINLGLDLQGGSHLLLRVDMDVVIQERLESMAETIRLEFRQQKLRFSDLDVVDGTVVVTLRNASDGDAAREVFQEFGPVVSITQDGPGYSIAFNEQGLIDLQD